MKVRFLLILVSILLCVEFTIVFGFNNTNALITNFLEIQLLVLYFVILFDSLKRFKISNLYTLFLLCLGLFNFQKFLWYKILVVDYKKFDSLVYRIFEEQTIQMTIILFCIVLVSLHFSFLFFTRKNRSIEFRLLHYDEKLFKIGKILFLVTLPFNLYKIYLEFSSLSILEYQEIYLDSNIGNIPSYLKLFSLFFQVSYMIILASVPNRRNFIFFSIIFICCLLPSLVLGYRAFFAVSLLTCLWYYLNFYEKKLNYFKIFAPLLVVIVLFQFIASSRVDGDNNDFKVIKAIPSFFYAQSQSMYVLSLYIDERENISSNKLPFVIDPLISWIYTPGQNIKSIQDRSSLGHHLTFNINSNYYLGGYSIGSNFIAELYEYGVFVVIIGTVLFSVFIYSFNRKFKSSRICLFFSLLFLQFILLAPRSSLLPSVYSFFKVFIVYIIILLLFNNLNKKYFR